MTETFNLANKIIPKAEKKEDNQRNQKHQAMQKSMK